MEKEGNYIVHFELRSTNAAHTLEIGVRMCVSGTAATLTVHREWGLSIFFVSGGKDDEMQADDDTCCWMLQGLENKGRVKMKNKLIIHILLRSVVFFFCKL